MSDLTAAIQAVLGDRYVVERELPPGGMSRLFLAIERSLDRRVVIKVLPPEYVDAVSVARFEREIAVTALLQHPHLLPVLAAGSRDGLSYYVTPYVAGDSLRQLLEREGRLPVAEAVRILRDLADALAFAHGHGVIHRDIKPSNVLLAGRLPVLADFGIAHALIAARSRSPRLTGSGMHIGTIGYMSPEQVAGEAEVDGRSDIYALGVVGYEMLTGAPPFASRSAPETMRAHLGEKPPSVKRIRPETPPAVSDALDKALAKAPVDRFATAAEFRDSLDHAMTQPAGVWPRSQAVLMGALAVLAVVALTIAGLRWPRTPLLNRKLIAVAPFMVADSSDGLWREGLVDVLSRNLDGMGALRTVNSASVLENWTGPSDRRSAEALGRRTGAGLVILGALTPLSLDSTGRAVVSLRATVLDVGAGRAIGEVQRTGPARELFALADGLTTDLLGVIGAGGEGRSGHLASLGSSSPAALKMFLEGERAYRGHKYLVALSAYERAATLDTTFALAFHGAAGALEAEMGGVDSNALHYALRAGALGQRGLSERDSLLLAADSVYAAAHLDPRPAFRERYARRFIATLERLVLAYPTDRGAWEELGGARLELGERSGLTREQALDAYEQAMKLDSTYGPVYFYLLELGAELRPDATTRSYASRYASIDRDDVGSVLFSVMDPARKGAPTGRWLDSMPAWKLEKAGFMLRRWRDADEVALKLGRRAMRDTAPSVVALASNWLPQALAFRGHIHESYRGAAAAHRKPGEFLTALALLGAVPEDSARALLAMAEGSRDPVVLAYMLPWWASRNDARALGIVSRRLDGITSGRSPTPDWLDPTPEYAAAAAKAYLALANGDTASALSNFAAVPDSICSFRCWPDRLVHARILAATGWTREAASVLDRRPLSQSTQTPGELLWLLERAQLAEELGDRERAASAYSYVRAAWIHADTDLAPLVAQASRGLARLQREGVSAGSDHRP